MKKRTVLALLLAFAMSASAFAMSACSKKEDEGENNKPNNSQNNNNNNNNNNPKPSEPEVPADTGTLKDNIFEAEAAEYTGVSSNNSTNFGHACEGKSYFFDASLSGGLCVRNVSPKSSENNYFTFRFNSDKAVKVTMEVAVASRYDNGWNEMNFSNMYQTVVNGKSLTADAVVPAATSADVLQNNNYACIKKIELPITLKEGENTIVFNCLAKSCNLDYINIKTSATLSGWTNHYWALVDDVVSIKKEPTLTATGTITFGCTDDASHTADFTLPALTDAFYTKTEETDKDVYSFELQGKTFTFEVAKGQPSTPDPEEPDDPDVPEEPAKTEIPADQQQYNAMSVGSWYKFGSKGNTQDGTYTEEEFVKEGALTFTAEKTARMDLFKVNATPAAESATYVNLVDKTDNFKTSGTAFYGYEYTYDLSLAATGDFAFVLFGTGALPASFSNAHRGIYAYVTDGTITLKQSGAGGDKVQASATYEGEVSDITSISIAVTRLNNTNILLKMSVNGTKLSFTGSPTCAKITPDGDYMDTVVTASNGYGQRFGIVPAEEATVSVSDIKLYKSNEQIAAPAFPTVTAVNPVGLELDGDSIYYVITGTCENFTAETLKEALSLDFTDYTNWKPTYIDKDKIEVTVDGEGAFVIKADITDLPVDCYLAHLTGVGLSGSGDIGNSNGIEKITCNSKAYSYQNHDFGTWKRFILMVEAVPEEEAPETPETPSESTPVEE